MVDPILATFLLGFKKTIIMKVGVKAYYSYRNEILGSFMQYSKKGQYIA